MGNSNPGSVSLGPQWLLGNRYTHISSEMASQRVSGDGELESGVRFPWTTMVARQPIYPDFTEMGFQGFQTWRIRIGVRLPRMRMVAKQPIHPDFIDKRFPGYI